MGGREAQLWGRHGHPGTHPVSLGPSDASCSPLTGHPLQTWRALSPRGASWARCTLWGGGGSLCWTAPAQDPSTQASFPSLPPLPTPFLFCLPSALLQYSFLLSTSHSSFSPSRASQAGPHNPNSLTYFGTVRAGSAGEAAGALEALGPGRATFTWETSFALW